MTAPWRMTDTTIELAVRRPRFGPALVISSNIRLESRPCPAAADEQGREMKTLQMRVGGSEKAAEPTHGRFLCQRARMSADPMPQALPGTRFRRAGALPGGGNALVLARQIRQRGRGALDSFSTVDL